MARQKGDVLDIFRLNKTFSKSNSLVSSLFFLNVLLEILKRHAACMVVLPKVTLRIIIRETGPEERSLRRSRKICFHRECVWILSIVH